MSAIETENQLDLENLPDARIPDIQGFTTAREALLKAAKSAVGFAKKSYGANDAYAAARAAIRKFIILPSGHPDWAGRSDAYSLAVQAFDSATMTSMGPEEKRRFDEAVRKQANRKHTPREVIAYSLATTNGLGEELALWESGEEGQAHVIADPSAALVEAVREHYASTAHGKKPAMVIPETFVKFAVPKNDPVIDKKDPPSVLKALTDSLAGLQNIVPLAATMGVLNTLSALSVSLTDGKLSEIKDRAKVAAVLYRIGTVATTTARMIDTDKQASENVSEEDEAALTTALFDAKEDKL